MRRGVAVLVLVASGLLVAQGCGREDVELAGAAATDAGSDPRLREGGAAPSCDAGAVRTCRPLDRACQLDAECCSSRCESGVCLPAGACATAGAACATSAGCCSGRCEPVRGTTNRACAPLCRPASAACAAGQECCSGGCRGGLCSDRACVQVGESCAAPSDCCSGACEDGRCRVDAVILCRASGEDCSSGGGQPCCFGCVDDRCDPGPSAPGTCRPRTAPCGNDAECCSGSCTGGEGARACAGVCGAEGVACTASSDCCSGACSASPGFCVAAERAACGTLGEACTNGGACCSGICQDGRCADNCGALR